jgi:2-(1,2-epoxy-1,2-dihydrophenyl)acetyl-CoA isomerase
MSRGDQAEMPVAEGAETMATVLLHKRSDGVGLITLNRPDSLNAMGEDLLPRLADALEDCAADDAVRCVAITGAGRAFCAGGDVKGMAAGNARSGEGSNDGGKKAPSIDAQIDGLWKSELATSHRVYTMPKPTVALLNGVAAGGGMSLALACDIRIASDKARLVTAFRNVGLGGDYGMNYLLPRFVGPGRARELLFRGENLNIQEAYELGVVNRIIPHETFMDEALTYCAELAAGPTGAIARMKQNMVMAEQASLSEALRQEATNLTLGRLDADHHEAAQAFVEKRTPSFRGE